MHKFIRDDWAEKVELTLTASSDATVDELFEFFKRYLAACGYVVDSFEFVKNEEDYEL